MKAMLFAAVIAGVSMSAILIFLQHSHNKKADDRQRRNIQDRYDGKLRLGQHAMG